MGVQKHRGKLVPDISGADFVILGHPTTQNFESWLRQAHYFGKTPVNPDWVLQSVKEGVILDLEEFEYVGLTAEKKKGRPNSTGQRYVLKTVKSESKSPRKRALPSSESEPEDEDDAFQGRDDSEEEVPPPRKRSMKKEAVKKEGEKKAKEEKVKVKAEKKTEKKASSSKVKSVQKGSDKHSSSSSKGTSKPKKDRAPTPVGHWEPSPPPPTRIEQHSNGKNLYTREDLDYCDEYIRILLLRDPTMSVTAIADKLFAKVCSISQFNSTIN